MAKWFRSGWAVIIVSGIALELGALANPSPGDTLSEQVWWLLGLNPALWVTGVGLSALAFWHFFFHRS